jgi:hypothetical protein
MRTTSDRCESCGAPATEDGMTVATDYAPSPLVREALALLEWFATTTPPDRAKDGGRYLHAHIRAYERLIRRLYAERSMVECGWCSEHYPAEQTIATGVLASCVRCAADYDCEGWLTGTITDADRDDAMRRIIEHGQFPVVAVPLWVER